MDLSTTYLGFTLNRIVRLLSTTIVTGPGDGGNRGDARFR